MADVASFVDPRLVKRLKALVPTSCCGSTPPEPQFGHTGQLTHIFCAICTTYFTTVTTFELVPNFGRGQRQSCCTLPFGRQQWMRARGCGKYIGRHAHCIDLVEVKTGGVEQPHRLNTEPTRRRLHGYRSAELCLRSELGVLLVGSRRVVRAVRLRCPLTRMPASGVSRQ